MRDTRSVFGHHWLLQPPEKASLKCSCWRPDDWILGTTAGQWTFLAAIAVAQLLLGTACWSLSEGTADYNSSFQHSFWISYGVWADLGTQTGLAVSDTKRARAVAVVFSIFGFIFNLAASGLVVDRIHSLMQHVKKRWSHIFAKGHILVLGWNANSIFLLRELLAAEVKGEAATRYFCGRRRRQVVILAQRSTLDMKQQVRMHLRTSASPYLLAFREGDPTHLAELVRVSASSAEDILVMGAGRGIGYLSGLGSDQGVVGILLALAAMPGRLSPTCDVFAEMQSREGSDAVKPLLPVAEGILARNFVGRMLALRVLVPSVGDCYCDIVSFNRGNSLYVRPIPPGLVGTTFAEACLLFPEAVPCGLRAKQLPGGVTAAAPCFAPDGDHVLEAGDELLLLAQSMRAAGVWRPAAAGTLPPEPDDACTYLAEKDLLAADGHLKLDSSAIRPMVVLIVGCSVDFPCILQHLDLYLAQGSTVHLLSPKPVAVRDAGVLRHFNILLGPAGAKRPEVASLFKRITIKHHVGPTTCRWALSELPLSTADGVLILSEYQSEGESPMALDSRNLTTAICLRTLLGGSGAVCGTEFFPPAIFEAKCTGTKMTECKIVIELLDPKSQRAVEGHDHVGRLGSFVYSGALETGLLAMAVQGKAAFTALNVLLDPHDGSAHVVAAPIGGIVQGTESLSFFDLHLRTQQACGGILLGWKRSEARYPELNPKSKAEVLTWREGSGDELLMLRPTAATVPSYRRPAAKAVGRAAPEAPALLPGCVPPGMWTG